MKLLIVLFSACLSVAVVASEHQLPPIRCEPALYCPLFARGLTDTAPECLVSATNSLSRIPSLLSVSSDEESGPRQQSSLVQTALARVTTRTMQAVVDNLGQIHPGYCCVAVSVCAGTGYVLLAANGYLPV